LIQPSKKSIAAIRDKLSTIIKTSKASSQEKLIMTLNPIIRGYAQYHKTVSSCATFRKLDWNVWKMLWTWALRRHKNKGKRWIAKKYWQPTLASNWVFKTSTKTLQNFTDTKIRYRKFLKLDTNPFLDIDYFKERSGVYLSSQRSIRMFLFCAHKNG